MAYFYFLDFPVSPKFVADEISVVRQHLLDIYT